MFMEEQVFQLGIFSSQVKTTGLYIIQYVHGVFHKEVTSYINKTGTVEMGTSVFQ